MTREETGSNVASSPSKNQSRLDVKPKITLIVRRGALRRFDRLKRDATELPVDVTWDRREQERRSAASKHVGGARKGERRRKPPFTWEVADFVVVERTTKGRTGSKRRRKT